MKGSITILVVDDEQMMLDLLQKILSREGYQVKTARDGAEALEILSQEPAHLVLTDIIMPNMDGFELLKEVKDKYPDTGVIVMTGYGDTYALKDALLAGADEYVTKPFRSHEISLVVERSYWRILSKANKLAATVE